MVVTSCRSCGSRRLDEVLSLGETPIANALLTDTGAGAPSAEGVEPRYPLGVAFCSDCALVQLTHALPAEVIFSEQYPYYSSYSPILLEHAARHAEELIRSRLLGSDSFVVELASNDGYLLKTFVAAGVPVLGVDPAPGPAGVAVEAGVDTVVDFFGLSLADSIRERRGQADVIIANNVLAHVPDLNDVVAGMAWLLADDGVITIENPYVRDLVEQCEFDTIYHEHYCYFSCTAIATLMRRHGLWLNDVEYFPGLHGGTLRWTISKRDEQAARAKEYIAAERRDGLTSLTYYQGFADRVEAVRADLRSLLGRLRADGARIAAYGAAAKGSTLANYADLGVDLVELVVDRNPHKQAHLMPGTHQRIEPVEVLLEEQPDYVLLFAWNFAEEIAQQQAEYVRRGGRFIRPIPTPEILQ
jgi:SAM-dependent methyltransferase